MTAPDTTRRQQTSSGSRRWLRSSAGPPTVVGKARLRPLPEGLPDALSVTSPVELPGDEPVAQSGDLAHGYATTWATRGRGLELPMLAAKLSRVYGGWSAVRHGHQDGEVTAGGA